MRALTPPASHWRWVVPPLCLISLQRAIRSFVQHLVHSGSLFALQNDSSGAVPNQASPTGLLQDWREDVGPYWPALAVLVAVIAFMVLIMTRHVLQGRI